MSRIIWESARRVGVLFLVLDPAHGIRRCIWTGRVAAVRKQVEESVGEVEMVEAARVERVGAEETALGAMEDRHSLRGGSERRVAAVIGDLQAG